MLLLIMFLVMEAGAAVHQLLLRGDGGRLSSTPPAEYDPSPYYIDGPYE